ncbi:MAG: hypothetical protein AAF228_03130 [Pseudomonadota bacterium]
MAIPKINRMINFGAQTAMLKFSGPSAAKPQAIEENNTGFEA